LTFYDIQLHQFLHKAFVGRYFQHEVRKIYL
jgi:hypothetical protein